MKEARFSSIQPIDMTLIRCYHCGAEWIRERWQWRGTPHSPKLQHCWNLTIRLFSVISRTLVVRGVLPLCREAVGVFYSPSRLGNSILHLISSFFSLFSNSLETVPCERDVNTTDSWLVVSTSLSCSTAFSARLHDSSIYQPFRFFSFSVCEMEQQN